MSDFISNINIENMFQDELLENEEILWTGQPDPNILFTSADKFLVPFSLLWGGFAIFWEAIVLSTGALPLFTLFGVPFVLIGMFLIFGRFIYKKHQKKRTFYAVTNQRVLILIGDKGKSLQSAFIKQILVINKEIQSDGIGTIQFGNESNMMSIYRNSGMDFFGRSFRSEVPAFYDIPNANEVYRLVNHIHSQS